MMTFTYETKALEELIQYLDDSDNQNWIKYRYQNLPLQILKVLGYNTHDCVVLFTCQVTSDTTIKWPRFYESSITPTCGVKHTPFIFKPTEFHMWNPITPSTSQEILFERMLNNVHATAEKKNKFTIKK